VRTFKIEYKSSLDLSGPSELVYIVSVKGAAGYGKIVEDTASFSVTIKNPCIDPAFVAIAFAPGALRDASYVLFEYPDTGFTFSHDAFSVVTKPFQHAMCGGLTY